MKALDLFSCIGCHAIGFDRAGIRTVQFCEVDPWRRALEPLYRAESEGLGVLMHPRRMCT